MNNKTLKITVGLPRSGKTTWARKQGHPIVSPDAIRLALHGQRFEAIAEPFVWAIALVMVRALFREHDCVIVDATNTTEKRRDFWKSDEWSREFIVGFSEYDECILRSEQTHDTAIIPIIRRMEKQWEPVTVSELLNDGERIVRRVKSI